MDVDTSTGSFRLSPLRAVLAQGHTRIGIGYLLLSMAAVTVGVLLSLLMRLHLAQPDLPIPGWGLIKPEDYLALVTMHGTFMVFFVLTLAPVHGFANLVLPAQIGSRRMAWLPLNATAFVIACLAFAVMLCAFLVPGGAPIGGWSAYAPFSALPAAGPGQGMGMDVWLAGVALFCVSQVLAAVSLLATLAGERCNGMSLRRVPLTVWSWLVAAILMLLIFSVLLAACLLLWADRHAGTAFFVPAGEVLNGRALATHGDGSPLLWLHLFWFFGHPVVYIAILPGMGLATSLFANFTRRPPISYRIMVAATLAIGLLSFVVWGHHMFVSGMNPYIGSAFEISTIAIALPSTVEVVGWLAMLSRSRIERTTPMLFALGFLSLFLAGGLTGPILGLPALDQYLHNTMFVVSHFHLVMGMAGAFSIFAGVYYWFPLLTGRLMNERLGRLHFWLSLLGTYATFLPMYATGLSGAPRHSPQWTGTPMAALQPWQAWVSHSAYLLATAQLIFIFNLVYSARRGVLAGPNPWNATTMEWAPATVFGRIRVQRGPYEYSESGTFHPQHEP